MKRALLSSIIVLFFLIGCARESLKVKVARPPSSKIAVYPETKDGRTPKPYMVHGEIYYPLPESHGFVQVGKASWYGGKFHGRPTSSGEIYNMDKKTAAHKTLPLGTYVKVLNLSNKKHTVVRVNDRGPFVKGRIIDLSRAAAKDIDLIGPGVVDVKVVALGREVGKSKSGGGYKPLVEVTELDKGTFTIQIGAFEDKENAHRIASRLNVIFDYVNIAVYVDENRRTLYRVHVSKSDTLTQAGKFEKKLEDMGFSESFIVRI